MAAFAEPVTARIEFSESSGRLSRVTAADVTVLLPWPMVKAFRRPQPRGPWTACTPDFAIPPDQDQLLRAGGAVTEPPARPAVTWTSTACGTSTGSV